MPNEARPYSHVKVALDTALRWAGAIYHGGVLKATSGGNSSVEVYDGFDTGGELIDAYYCAASNRDVHVLERGILVRTGLYIDKGDNVSAFTLHYEPPPRAE